MRFLGFQEHIGLSNFFKNLKPRFLNQFSSPASFSPILAARGSDGTRQYCFQHRR